MIFALSGSLGSFSETSRFIGPLLNFLFPDASPETLRYWHGIIRKMAHVGIYAVLAVLAVRALTIRFAPTASRLAGASLLLVVMIASLDEVNQSFLTSRSGTPWDVILDFSGGVLGLILGLSLYSRTKRSVQQPAEPVPE